jgi:CYTH domain-containing protein
MPTEHEYKYVLDIATDEEFFKKNCKKHLVIQQGYLAFSKGMTCRVRSSREEGQSDRKTKWYLTFKQKVRNRVIEVEKKLDVRDGKDLWSVCVGRLKKDRYVIHGWDDDLPGNKKTPWEVDFFKKGNLYFVLAEVELEEGSLRPKHLPGFIKKDLLYEVPLTDDRFGNKRLGDVEYATSLYEKIAQGEIDENSKEAEKD